MLLLASAAAVPPCTLVQKYATKVQASYLVDCGNNLFLTNFFGSGCKKHSGSLFHFSCTKIDFFFF